MAEKFPEGLKVADKQRILVVRVPSIAQAVVAAQRAAAAGGGAAGQGRPLHPAPVHTRWQVHEPQQH